MAKKEITKNNINSRGGQLGPWMLTSLVVGNMIGSGIFMLPASLAVFGSISIVAWILTAIGSMCLALVFSNLSRRMPHTGGPYIFCREVLGNFAGFQVAYNYWIYICVGTAGIAVAFTSYLGVFWPVLNENHVFSFFVKAGVIWMLTLISIFGVRNAGLVQLLTTVLKILPLALVGIVGIFFVQGDNLAHFNVSGMSDLSALTGAATLTLWAFTGLESATVPADEVDNPANIQRATILGTLIATLIYILSTIVIMGMFNVVELQHSTAPFADAGRKIFGQAGVLIITIGAVISCFGALNGWIMLQGQIPKAAARDGVFPKLFARESRYKTPAVGLLISSLFITMLLTLTISQGLLKQFTFITLLATLAVLVPYLLSSIAELVLLLRDKKQFSGVRLFKSLLITTLAILYSLWAIIGSGTEIIIYGSILFLSGVPIYLIKCRRSYDSFK
ncbi:MAG: amino acid permease [Oligoflexia bacterium]|nr:amino acid permease [Oligoflexia bacterium]